MTTTLTFDGTTAALGKDGWYQLGRVEVFVIPEYGEAIIELRGRGQMTDVQAMLHIYDPDELRTLICGLAKALAQMTEITED